MMVYYLLLFKVRHDRKSQEFIALQLAIFSLVINLVRQLVVSDEKPTLVHCFQ
jgi:hypothetical protein